MKAKSADESVRVALRHVEPDFGAHSGTNIWIRLDEKAAEQQDAQKHNDCYDDDLNERHGLFLVCGPLLSNWAMSKAYSRSA